MNSRALLIGRFQPPHLGHLSVINNILQQYDEIIIVIAAAQLSHTMKNPLTAGERVTLMRAMLENNQIGPKRYWLIPAQDIMDNALWVYHIRRLIPRFDTFFGNNPFTSQLFKEAGIKVQHTEMLDRNLFEGTTIRKKLLRNEDLSQQLDSEVHILINNWNIKNRLQAAQNENPVNDLV